VRTVLGVIASARRWGNSEVMVREALAGVQAAGVEGCLLRLTDLRLEPCTGCMRCTIGGSACPLDDDMPWLIETLMGADGLILAAPTYFLGPAAVVKLVLDRLLMLTPYLEARVAPRPAATVAVSGLRDWVGVTIPFLNALALSFGYRPIESLHAVAPGPGEVLLDPDLLDRVRAAGVRVGQGKLEPNPVPPNVCPTCRCDAFILRGGDAVCPICGQMGQLEDGHLAFDQGGAGRHRWEPDALREHIHGWVIPTGGRFLGRRQEIKARRARFQDQPVEWIAPGS
jgi:hypothetical protein